MAAARSWAASRSLSWEPAAPSLETSSWARRHISVAAPATSCETAETDAGSSASVCNHMEWPGSLVCACVCVFACVCVCGAGERVPRTMLCNKGKNNPPAHDNPTTHQTTTTPGRYLELGHGGGESLVGNVDLVAGGSAGGDVVDALRHGGQGVADGAGGSEHVLVLVGDVVEEAVHVGRQQIDPALDLDLNQRELEVRRAGVHHAHKLVAPHRHLLHAGGCVCASSGGEGLVGRRV